MVFDCYCYVIPSSTKHLQHPACKNITKDKAAALHVTPLDYVMQACYLKSHSGAGTQLCKKKKQAHIRGDIVQSLCKKG